MKSINNMRMRLWDSWNRWTTRRSRRKMICKMSPMSGTASTRFSRQQQAPPKASNKNPSTKSNLSRRTSARISASRLRLLSTRSGLSEMLVPKPSRQVPWNLLWIRAIRLLDRMGSLLIRPSFMRKSNRIRLSWSVWIFKLQRLQVIMLRSSPCGQMTSQVLLFVLGCRVMFRSMMKTIAAFFWMTWWTWTQKRITTLIWDWARQEW